MFSGEEEQVNLDELSDTPAEESGIYNYCNWVLYCYEAFFVSEWF